MSSEAAKKAYPERVLPLCPEPPIGTWARDRFGGITYRQANGGWGQPGVMPFGKWEAMYDARGPYVETGPWGKPLGGRAVSARDELEQAITDVMESFVEREPTVHDISAAVIAEGWRKMPSRDELAEAIDDADHRYTIASKPRDTVANFVADAILALMDRGQ